MSVLIVFNRAPYDGSDVTWNALRPGRATAQGRSGGAPVPDERRRGPGTEAVDRAELLCRARAGQVTVLDVRPAEEYAAGHLPGAVSVPLAELPDRLAEIPAETEIVAYCRGTYCVFSREAVRLLTAHGRTARRLDGGVLEWTLSDLPLDGDTTGTVADRSAPR